MPPPTEVSRPPLGPIPRVTGSHPMCGYRLGQEQESLYTTVKIFYTYDPSGRDGRTSVDDKTSRRTRGAVRTGRGWTHKEGPSTRCLCPHHPRDGETSDGLGTHHGSSRPLGRRSGSHQSRDVSRVSLGSRGPETRPEAPPTPELQRHSPVLVWGTTLDPRPPVRPPPLDPSRDLRT